MEGPVRRWWSGKGSALGVLFTPLALPLGVVFGVVVRIRNLLYDRDLLATRRAPVPVVSVGNLSVGGTGKTPVASWLVSLLVERGRSPAVVLRGYGRDEVELHRRWHPALPVAVHRDRVRACRAAVGEGADVCVLDDGFQHRRLRRDLDIVLLSPADPLPARLLPRGPYREPLGALRRADLVLVPYRTREERRRSDELLRAVEGRGGFPPAYPLRLAPGDWQDLSGEPATPPDGPVLAVSSVARPEGVAAVLREAGLQVTGVLAYPDHHEYREEDIVALEDAGRRRTLVTTEKDAVKLLAFRDRLAGTRVLPLRPRPVGALLREVERAMDRALSEDESSATPRGTT